MIDALRWMLPLVGAWQLSGHPDGAALADAASDYAVPVSLMWAIAYEETRHDITNTPVSRAGAVGRMQVMPRYWRWQCGPLWGHHRYAANVACGALILRYYLSSCREDMRCAAWHYVGGDSRYARSVGFRSLVYELQMAVAARGD